jgi:hypothetical protein
MATGPIICTTSGRCVPGASCEPLDRLVCWVCFGPLPWANNATAIPRTQNTEAVKMRRLKKADCEVDFFFIDEVSFPCEVEWRSYRTCQTHVNTFFKFFRNFRCKDLNRDTDLKLAPFPTRSPLPLVALPSISLFPSARFTDNSEISRQLVAILVFLGNVTMLLPFGARYPQDKSAPQANMPKTSKKMHDQRTCLFQGIFGPRNTRKIRMMRMTKHE